MPIRNATSAVIGSARACVVDVRRDLDPRHRLRIAQHVQQVHHHAAKHRDAAIQVLGEREDREPEARERIDARHEFRRLADGIERGDAVEDVALRVGERDDVLRQPVPPDAPQRLAAHVVHPLDARQVPLADGVAAQLAQTLRHAAPVAVAREGERGPLP